MELENRVLELQEKAVEMGKYYYKGFGNSIYAIISSAEAYLENSEINDYAEVAYMYIRKIKDFYETIPFDTLHGKEEFYPLLRVRELLPRFQETLNEVFNKKSEGELEYLITLAGAIIKVGGVYWLSFMQVLKEIRTIPGYENFQVEIKDQFKDFTWFFPIQRTIKPTQ